MKILRTVIDVFDAKDYQIATEYINRVREQGILVDVEMTTKTTTVRTEYWYEYRSDDND